MRRWCTPLFFRRSPNSVSSYPPSFECLVVSVDAQGVLAPEGHVAAAGIVFRAEHAVEGRDDGDAHDVVAAVNAPGEGRERGDHAAEHLLREFAGQHAARAGDVAAAAREGQVVLDEVALQDQVAVDLMR